MRSPSKFEKIAFGQDLRLSWLDFAVALVIQGTDSNECRDKLAEYIANEETLSGARGGAQVKRALSLLTGWYKPAKDIVLYRNFLIQVAKQIPRNQWPILHWCILSACYPFFANVTKTFGRLFYLQGQLNKSQIESRLSEIYGARPYLERRIRYAISTLANLKMLSTDRKSGLYTQPEEHFTTNFETTAALWKAVLLATKGGRMSLIELQNYPGFYPFSMTKICLEQFKSAFTDVDYQQYATCGEQVFLKDSVSGLVVKEK